MSNDGSGQGGFGQNQQSFTYNDGTTQMSYSSQQYGWSSSPQGTPVQSPAPISPQQMNPQVIPQMLPMPDMNQIHQQHMNLHHSSMQSAMQMHQTAMDNMARQFRSLQPSTMPAHEPQPQQQIQYAPCPLPVLPPPQDQPLQIEAAREQPREDPRAVERDRQMLGFAQRIEDRMHRNDQQSQEQVVAQFRREAAREAQNQKFQSEQRELTNNLSSQITELRQAQASTPQQASPAFDMETLQKVIRDAQKGHASKDDLKTMINEAVSKQLSGVARSSDLEKSASRMEKSLHKVSGGSDAQIQDIVQKELASAISKVASRMPTRQQRIEASYQQQNVVRQPAPTRIETEFIVEELSDSEEEAKKVQESSSHPQQPLPTQLMQVDVTAKQPSFAQRKATVLSVANTSPDETTALTSDALERLQAPTNAAKGGSRSHHSQSRASVMPSEENTMVRVKNSDYKPSRSSKLSTVSVQPSPSNAMVRSDTGNIIPVEAKPSRSSKMSTMSVQPSESNALVPKGGYAQQLDIPPTKNPKMSVQSSDANALVRSASAEAREHHDTGTKSSKLSTMSVQPSPINALVRPASAPAEDPKHSSRAGKSSKTSTMSVQPSPENAVGRSRTSDRQQYTSAAQAIAVAHAKDGIPDNTSQWTAREKDQAAKRSTPKGSTISSIRPRNDRRGNRVASSPLKQIETVREEDEGSMALVKQSHDVSKKSGR